MSKTRRKIDVAVKAKATVELLRTQSTVLDDLAELYQVHPNQIYARKNQLQQQEAPAFDAKAKLASTIWCSRPNESKAGFQARLGNRNRFNDEKFDNQMVYNHIE